MGRPPGERGCSLIAPSYSACAGRQWHSKPAGCHNKKCPICGLPARINGEHRAASVETHERRYLHRTQTADGPVETEVGPLFARTGRGPSQKVLKGIARATALLADGKTMREIAAGMKVAEQSIREWRKNYAAVWRRAFDNAMAAVAAVVEAQAGTLDVLADPAGFLAKAEAAKKWSDEQGRQFLPVKDGTLRAFFDSYYRPVRLSEVSHDTIQHYERALRYWAAFTGDPPLEKITAATMAMFRDCLKQLRGHAKSAWVYSPATVHGMLVRIQWILDKAGPPGRGNRDAAGILAVVPWIKPPKRFDHVGPPKIVSLELLTQLYDGLVAAELPRLNGFRPSAWWRALIVLAYNTGLRRGSLFGLRMSDVDWQQQRLLVRRGNNKSKKLFAIHLNEPAMRHLSAIRTDRELIFPWPHDPRYFDAVFRRLQTAAGILRADQFGLHNLRKTLATALFEQGSPGAAQLALGHSAATTTERHYVAPSAIVSRALDALPQPAAFAALEPVAAQEGGPSV